MAPRPASVDLHAGPGFRVRTDFPRLSNSLMRRFESFDSPEISDLLNRMYALDDGIKCLTSPEHRLCGPVCTVKVGPGDNLMVHKVLDIARPGDIVVIDAHASMMNAVLGDMICTKAWHRKIAGFVVDGLIRDLPGILEMDFPVFARGTTAMAASHRGPGEINYPVSCGGIVVNPGDVLVADQSGIVVVPHDIAPELLKRLQSHRSANAAYLAAVQRGDFCDEWVDTLLAEHQCPIESSNLEAGDGEDPRMDSPLEIPQPPQAQRQRISALR